MTKIRGTKGRFTKTILLQDLIQTILDFQEIELQNQPLLNLNKQTQIVSNEVMLE